jgi:hypothetical protein
VTISHLHFGPHGIHAPTTRARQAQRHPQADYVQYYDIVRHSKTNRAHANHRTWAPEALECGCRQKCTTIPPRFAPARAQRCPKDLRKGGLGQAHQIDQAERLFVKLSGAMPLEPALELLAGSIERMAGQSGHKAVQMNIYDVSASISGTGAVREPFRRARHRHQGGVLDSYHCRIQVPPYDFTGCELCVRIGLADAL